MIISFGYYLQHSGILVQSKLSAQTLKNLSVGTPRTIGDAKKKPDPARNDDP